MLPDDRMAEVDALRGGIIAQFERACRCEHCLAVHREGGNLGVSFLYLQRDGAIWHHQHGPGHLPEFKPVCWQKVPTDLAVLDVWALERGWRRTERLGKLLPLG